MVSTNKLPALTWFDSASTCCATSSFTVFVTLYVVKEHVLLPPQKSISSDRWLIALTSTRQITVCDHIFANILAVWFYKNHFRCIVHYSHYIIFEYIFLLLLKKRMIF